MPIDPEQQPANPAPAPTGNASNPSPEEATESQGPLQLLPKEAETYLRESGNIEDMPEGSA